MNVAPTTVQTRGVVQHIPNTNSDFPTDVVKDVLSTAFDAVASAGRAIVDTVDNLLTGTPRPEPTATYNPEQGCELSVNQEEGDHIRVCQITCCVPYIFQLKVTTGAFCRMCIIVPKTIFSLLRVLTLYGLLQIQIMSLLRIQGNQYLPQILLHTLLKLDTLLS